MEKNKPILSPDDESQITSDLNSRAKTPVDGFLPSEESRKGAENYRQAAKPKSRFLRLIPPIIIILIALGLYFFIDLTAISDWSRGRSFEPTRQMQTIITDLDLTPIGSRIFTATHPTLKNNPAFTDHCGENNEGVSIIGCYAAGNIFIKHVTDPDLDGILESTAAHELLHAVWARLDEPTRKQLAVELDRIYSSNLDLLGDRLKNYEEQRWHDELHSIIGTEFTNIGTTLSAHYNQYFNNRSRIVAFWTAYNSKFQILREKSEALHAQIIDLKDQIDIATARYESGVDQLNADIADFRRRAESGGFSGNPTAFYREQNALNARVDEFNALFVRINDQITQVNTLIEEYNANSASLNELNQAISSPTPIPTV